MSAVKAVSITSGLYIIKSPSPCEDQIPFSGGFDVEAEKVKIQKDLDYQLGFLNSVRRKLTNEKFVNGAPDAVVANERKKEADAVAKIAILEEKLADLG